MAKDKFTNVAFGEVTESAANTLTFSQIQTGVQLWNKQAWIIHQVHWHPQDLTILEDENDSISCAIVSSNRMSVLGLSDPGVIALTEFKRVDSGVPADFQMYTLPQVQDFTEMPSGGLIVPANPIFVAAEGVSNALPFTVSARIYFSMLDLKAEEFLELVESTRMIQ